jgi:hypothetical protein
VYMPGERVAAVRCTPTLESCFGSNATAMVKGEVKVL